MAAPTNNNVASIEQRVRFSNLPPVAEAGEASREIPWSRRTSDFTRIDLDATAQAHEVLAIEKTRAWQEHAVPALKTVDASRKMAHALYTSAELERVSLFAFLTGNTIKEARTLLCSDKGAVARKLLGFDKPRNPPKRQARMKLLDGVPSEASLCRHNKRFDLLWRLSVMEKAALAARDEHLRFESFRDEVRVLGQDGTKVETHYTPELKNKAGKVVNADRVTAPDAGFMSHKTAPPEKAGAGWCLVAAVTLETRIPVVLPVVERNGEPETTMGIQVVKRIKNEISPALGERVGVMVMDGGFNDHELRATLHEAGYLDCCHVASHNLRSEKTLRSVKRRNNTWYPIDGHPNWEANGHREIRCKCGHRPAKQIEKLKNGGLSVRVEGKCNACGRISIKAGRWTLSNKRFVRCAPGTEVKERDYTFGNPLTYNDGLATRYGNLRHGHGEGYFAQLASRFGINDGKRWLRRADQVRLESAIAFLAVHTLSMERRLAKGEVPDPQTAPPQALAA